MKKRHKLKPILQNLALLAFTMLFLLVLTEIGLRLFFPQSDFFYKTDPVLGALLIPNAEGIAITEGQTHSIKINEWGFHGWEASLEKDPGVVRIAILGDSFIEAMQVEEDQMLQKQLEQWLNEHVEGKTFEVLSFGVSGYGTAQQYILYQEYVRPFDPDIVISMTTPINDIRNNHQALENDPHRPYFVLDEKGALERVDFNYSEDRIRRFISFFLNNADFLRQLDTYRFFIDRVVRPIVNLKSGKTTQSIPVEYFVFGCEYDETWREAWDVTYAILNQWKQEAEEEGRLWLLVNGTTTLQIHGETAWADLMETYPEMKEECWNLERPNEMLQAWATETDSLYLDLLPAFKEEYLSEGIEHHLEQDGHWNETGHKAVAENIGNWLLSLGIFPN